MGGISGELLSVRLRRETAAAHAAIEGQLNVFGPGLTVGRYAELLRRWRGFYEAWEPAATGWFAGREDFFARRSKVDFLRRDLAVCGEASVTERCELGGIFPEDEAGALGTLYVTEGSTLGGQILSRRIGELLGFTPERGGAFFASYGVRIGAMWVETKGVLDEERGAEMRERIVEGARGTFEFLGEWLGK